MPLEAVHSSWGEPDLVLAAAAKDTIDQEPSPEPPLTDSAEIRVWGVELFASLGAVVEFAVTLALWHLLCTPP